MADTSSPSSHSALFDRYPVHVWLADRVRTGADKAVGYIHGANLIQLYRSRETFDLATLPAHLRPLVSRDNLEYRPDDDRYLRLKPAVELRLILDDLVVDQWRGSVGVQRLTIVSGPLAQLLSENTAAAVDIDPLAAVYTTLVAIEPTIRRSRGHELALEVLDLSEIVGGPVDLAALLRFLLAGTGTGTPVEDLLTVAVGALT